jgi:hypothetical protein
LDQADDSVAIGDGTTLFDAAVQDVAAGAGHAGFASMAVHDATLTALTSADGDFEHLRVNANGALWVQHDGEIAINDGGNSITVDATDLDIRDLTAASDSVESWTHDGTGTAITSTAENGDQALDVHISNAGDIGDDFALADTAIAHAANALDVADTAEDVVASPLANRKYLFIYNNGNRRAYIGASGVSAAAGFPVSPGSYLELRAGASLDIEWVSADTNQEIRTLELS